MIAEELDYTLEVYSASNQQKLWILYEDLGCKVGDCTALFTNSGSVQTDSLLFSEFVENVVLSAGDYYTSAIIMVPLQFKPQDILSQVVLGNTCVGIYYYHTLDEGREYMKKSENSPVSRTGNRAVLAMWKDQFLAMSKGLHTSLVAGEKANSRNIYQWFSDEVSRNDLVTRLSTTALDLVMYVGHGRSRGWSGYRGLRWHHIEASTPTSYPIGALIALTCDNLKFEKDRIPFGIQWVASGRARSFLGATTSVQIIPMVTLCKLIEKIMTENAVATIGELVVQLDILVKEIADIELQKCWSAFRLVGDPTTFI